MQPPSQPTVAQGDTLIGLVKSWHREHGSHVTDAQAFRQAHQVARANDIHNADLIHPGQQVSLAVLQQAGAPADSRRHSSNPLLGPNATAAQVLAQRLTAQRVPPPGAPVSHSGHSVLDHTLQRAQARGFIPAAELPAVRQRIVEMAGQFGFAPDDFARVSMMESDGFNPKANNGRCFGVIQFCSGKGQGADSVGMADRPKEILQMSVLQQMDLVETYFKDTGLDRMGPRVSLSDLYLTVLTPAARQVRNPNATLPIAGVQAQALYEGGRVEGRMTRNSLVQGLHAVTNQRLGLDDTLQRQRVSGQRQPLAAALQTASGNRP